MSRNCCSRGQSIDVTLDGLLTNASASAILAYANGSVLELAIDDCVITKNGEPSVFVDNGVVKSGSGAIWVEAFNGAVLDLNLTATEVTRNRGEYGGGIVAASFSGATLTINVADCTLFSNRVSKLVTGQTQGGAIERLLRHHRAAVACGLKTLAPWTSRTRFSGTTERCLVRITWRQTTL